MSSAYQGLASDILQQVKECWETWLDYQRDNNRHHQYQWLLPPSSASSSSGGRRKKRRLHERAKDDDYDDGVLVTPSESESSSTSNPDSDQPVLPAELRPPFPKKEKRSFQVGDRVRKHYPTSGWYNGKVASIQPKKSDSSTLIYTIRYDDGDEEELFEEHLADVIVRRDDEDDTLYSLEQFHFLWSCLSPELVEKSSVIRRANSALGPQDAGQKDSSEFVQHTAQYGRVMPEATDRIFQILQLKKGDCFLDIGHGLGNTCFQAAYTIGCQARGIEVVRDRYKESTKFYAKLKQLAQEQDDMDGTIRSPGPVLLKHADLADPLHHNWLVKANKVFINNFGGLFAERSERARGASWLDHYVSGLFASMEEGSMILSLHDLQLGPTRTEVNKWREENGLEHSANASFFEVSKIELGLAGEVFSWSTSCKTPASAFLYRRVHQDSNLRGAVLLCCNKKCEKAIKGIPTSATALNSEGRVVMGACECKFTLRSTRRLQCIKFEDYIDSHPIDGR